MARRAVSEEDIAAAEEADTQRLAAEQAEQPQEDRVSVLEADVAALKKTVTDASQKTDAKLDALLERFTPPASVSAPPADEDAIAKAQRVMADINSTAPGVIARFRSPYRELVVIYKVPVVQNDKWGRPQSTGGKNIQFSAGIYDAYDEEEVEFLRHHIQIPSTRGGLMGDVYEDPDAVPVHAVHVSGGQKATHHQPVEQGSPVAPIRA